MTDTAPQALADDVTARAREMLASQFPAAHPNWGPFRENILDGSCSIHSDAASAVASMAVRAIEAAIIAGRERCATLAPAAPVEGMVERAIKSHPNYGDEDFGPGLDLALEILATLDKPQGVGDNGG